MRTAIDIAYDEGFKKGFEIAIKKVLRILEDSETASIEDVKKVTELKELKKGKE